MSGRLTPERFREIEALFEKALALDREARSMLLESAGRDDPELAEAVRRLIEEDSRGDDHDALQTGVDRALGAIPAGRDRVGTYRLRRRLGSGGMGVVYEAVQEEPLRRTVALKRLRFGAHDAVLARRFAAEAQALARLNHPNIAQVYEVGEDRDGEPYLAMELIEGEPLTDHCAQRGLDLRTRIALMLSVCRGVQHAHQRGIVHRDLKPANVLVASGDDGAVPKVIDFGIAKALAGDIAGTALTRIGEAIGTLEYMSPEQTRGPGEADTRSDVYALGAMFYEILTGTLPVPRALLEGGGVDAACRAIREHPVQRPSRALAARGSGASTWPIRARSLRGELDWIVLKALEKDPERRYASVSELIADLEAYLEGRSVQAGPPSARYRLRKLVWRHRWAVGAIGLVVLSLLVASAGLAIGLIRARDAEATARLEAESSQRVADFLVEIFEAADPREGGAAQTPVGEVLERAAATLQGMDIDPMVEARLRDAMGRAFGNLGMFEAAHAQLEQALALREARRDTPVPEVARNLSVLASVLRRLDHLAASEAAYRRAVSLLEGQPSLRRELAEALNGLAVLIRTEKPDEARALYVRSLAANEAALGPDHPNSVRVRVNIATLEARAGRYEAASEAFRAALESAERAWAEDDPDLGGMLGNFAFVERKLGRYGHSRALLERALALEHARLGTDHPSTIFTHINLVAVCQRLGDLDAALLHGREAVRIAVAALPPDHHLTATARNNHAATLLRLGRPEEASRLAEEARSAVAGRGDGSARSVWVSNTLLRSGAERRAGNTDAAVALSDEALATLSEEPAASGRRLEALWSRAHALAAGTHLDAGSAAAAARALAVSAGIGSQSLEEARFAALSDDRPAAWRALQEALEALPADAGWIDDPELLRVLDVEQLRTFERRVRERLEAATLDGKAERSGEKPNP